MTTGAGEEEEEEEEEEEAGKGGQGSDDDDDAGWAKKAEAARGVTALVLPPPFAPAPRPSKREHTTLCRLLLVRSKSLLL